MAVRIEPDDVDHGRGCDIEVDPVWWSLSSFRRRLSRCPGHASLTRLSSVARWSNWSALAAIRSTSLASSSPQRNRSCHWVALADRQEGRREEKSPGLAAAERDELARLRRENKQLRLERDILSRAAAWFAREAGTIPSGSSNS